VSLARPGAELSTEDPVPLGGCGVLIIEETHAAHLLRTTWRRPGTRHLAVSGEAGLAAAKAEPPDAILLDLHLPGMDGWQVCTRSRRIRRCATCPSSSSSTSGWPGKAWVRSSRRRRGPGLELVAADLRHAGADVTGSPIRRMPWSWRTATPFDLVVTDLAIPRLDGSLWSTRCVPIGDAARAGTRVTGTT